MTDNFGSLIAHVTGGRRYCFVMMSYHHDYSFFEKLRKIVSEATGFECIRADDLPASGTDILTKVHNAIENSVFVIVDLSEPRPNINYEFGFAAARGKPVLLIAKEGSKIETDLQGLELITYTDNREGWQRFEPSLKKHLEIHNDSNIPVLRAMVLPIEPDPSFIVINPKVLQADSRFKHHPKEYKTYGDYLGLSGIMGAFATVYGEHVVPEIVNASYSDEGIAQRDANLFLIGSPKVNKFTAQFLQELQNGKSPNWHFEECPDKEKYSDYEMRLVGDHFRTKCLGIYNISKPESFEDYGLIVRGRHPTNKNRDVLILAGPHSIGTGSACLAATKTHLIKNISKALSGKAELTDRNKTIWVLVKGISDDTGHLDVSGVTIVEAGVI